MIGTTIGNYEVRRLIAEGGMVIKEMHESKPFDLETIVGRYNFEMRRAIQVLGGHQIFDQRIRLILETLFGGKYVRGAGLLTMR